MLSMDLYIFNESTNRCELGTRLNTIAHCFLELFFQNVEVYMEPLNSTKHPSWPSSSHPSKSKERGPLNRSDAN